jgi:archaellin
MHKNTHVAPDAMEFRIQTSHSIYTVILISRTVEQELPTLESPSRRMPLVEQELHTFQNTQVTITTNATSGAGTTYPSRMPESPSRRMPLVEQELLTLHNTRVTITKNATSGAGTTYPSRIPESPSR